MARRRVLYLDPKHKRRRETMDTVPRKMVNAVEDRDAARDALGSQPFDAVVAPLKDAKTFAEHARAFPILGFEETESGVTISFLGEDGGTVYQQDFKSVAEVITLLLDGRLFATIPIPENEDSRLEVIRNLPLNELEDEPALKTLTELAAHVFAIPASYIGIVNADKEHFLSCFGMDLEPTKREDTICAHTIAQEGVLVVEDTREDPRFKDKGFADAGIVSYAGAPIHNHHGDAVGTFCLVSEEPHRFSDADRELLKLFASEAWNVFELYTQLRDSRFLVGYI